MPVTPNLSLGTPQYAMVSISSSGDNTIVNAVPGQQISLISFVLVPAAAVAITFKSGAGTSLSGAMTIGGANQPPSLDGDENGRGWTATNLGDPLVINLGTAVAVNGMLTYALT